MTKVSKRDGSFWTLFEKFGEILRNNIKIREVENEK